MKRKYGGTQGGRKVSPLEISTLFLIKNMAWSSFEFQTFIGERMSTETDRKIEYRDNIIQKVKTDLISRLSLNYDADDLHEDVSLVGSGLGLDSLDALEVILGIEQQFQIKIEEGNITILRSINTLVDYIIQKQASVA